jgi:hypothetical protein
MQTDAPHLRRRPRALAVLAAGAVALGVLTSGVAEAAGIDPAVYDPGIPAGQVEHGKYTFEISGSAGNDQKRVIEYWLSATRWKSQTRDARSGELENAAVHDEHGTTWISYHPTGDQPPVIHFSGNDSIPGPGYPAPFNTKLLTTGVEMGPDSHRENVTLQPVGPEAVAGLQGTRFEVLTGGRAGVDGGAGDGSHSYITLENGTNKPLVRETTAPNGTYGTFDQKETLVSRETATSGAVAAHVSRVGIKRAISTWKAKVKAAKAAAKAKKHHHKQK